MMTIVSLVSFYHHTVTNFSLMIRTFKIYSFSRVFYYSLLEFKMYSTLLTIVTMLYITFSWLIYFITVNSYFLISIACFTQSAPSSGSPSLVSVSKTLFTFCFVGSFVLCFRPHKWGHLILVFVSHLSLYSLYSSMLSQMARFYLFMAVATPLTSSSIQ